MIHHSSAWLGLIIDAFLQLASCAIYPFKIPQLTGSRSVQVDEFLLVHMRELRRRTLHELLMCIPNKMVCRCTAILGQGLLSLLSTMFPSVHCTQFLLSSKYTSICMIFLSVWTISNKFKLGLSACATFCFSLNLKDIFSGAFAWVSAVPTVLSYLAGTQVKYFCYPPPRYSF